jgi:hypothetical protein
MKSSPWLFLVVSLGIPALVRGQASPSAPAEPDAKPCLIVRHKDTTGQRMMWFLLANAPVAPEAQFVHIHAINFDGYKPVYRGNDLNKFEDQGVRVIVLNKAASQQDLDQAISAFREPDPPSTQPAAESKPAP